MNGCPKAFWQKFCFLKASDFFIQYFLIQHFSFWSVPKVAVVRGYSTQHTHTHTHTCTHTHMHTHTHAHAHTLFHRKAAMAFIFPHRTFLPCCFYMMLSIVLASSVVLISIMNLTCSASWGTCLKYRLRDPNPQDSDTVSLAEDLYFFNNTSFECPW